MITSKLKYFAVTILASTGLIFTFSVFPALASCDNPVSNQEAIQCGTNNVSGTTEDPAQAETSINSTIQTFINILSAIVGVIAVIMIIVAGYRYVTSGGAAEK